MFLRCPLQDQTCNSSGDGRDQNNGTEAPLVPDNQDQVIPEIDQKGECGSQVDGGVKGEPLVWPAEDAGGQA